MTQYEEKIQELEQQAKNSVGEKDKKIKDAEDKIKEQER